MEATTGPAIRKRNRNQCDLTQIRIQIKYIVREEYDRDPKSTEDERSSTRWGAWSRNRTWRSVGERKRAGKV